MENLLNIIIPAYNEGENIKETIHEIENKIKTPNKIHIICDYDKDNTIPVVRELMKSRNSIKLLKNKHGKGFTNAIKTGFASIDAGVVLVAMADLADDFNKVDAMFAKINEGYDIVCGSRYMKGGKQIGGSRLKQFFSRTAGVSLYYLLGIPTHDVTNSFKMYKKSVLNNLEIESSGGYELGMEIIIKAFLNGYRITELPSTWRDRKVGKSRFKLWQWLPKYIHWYLFGLKGKIKNLLPGETRVK